MKWNIFILFLIGLGSIRASAEGWTPSSDFMALPNVPVTLGGNTRPLYDQLGQSQRPIFLVPFFTDCHSTCPIVIEKLKKVMGKHPEWEAQSHVVLLSFDPEDTDDKLQSFATTHGLNPNWKLIRTSADNIELLLNPYSFVTMKNDDQYVHPNEVLVFAGDFLWLGRINGATLAEEDIRSVIATANSRFSRPLWHRLRGWFLNNNILAGVGALGLLLSLLTIFVVVGKIRSRQ